MSDSKKSYTLGLNHPKSFNTHMRFSFRVPEIKIKHEKMPQQFWKTQNNIRFKQNKQKTHFSQLEKDATPRFFAVPCRTAVASLQRWTTCATMGQPGRGWPQSPTGWATHGARYHPLKNRWDFPFTNHQALVTNHH